MKRGIFCGRCGTNNAVHRFRCSECGASIRPVYPTVAALVTLCAVYALWLVFMKSVLPVFAGVLSSHGARFSEFVRVGIGASQHFTGWGVLLGAALIAVLGWIGLSWRPQDAWGRNLVVTVVFAKALGAFAFVLLATRDVLPFLAAP